MSNRTNGAANQAAKTTKQAVSAIATKAIADLPNNLADEISTWTAAERRRRAALLNQWAFAIEHWPSPPKASHQDISGEFLKLN